jgi:hypothetical protein
MRKGLIVLLAAVLVGAFTLPAMAEHEATGFIRTKGWVSNFANYSAGYIVPVDDPTTKSYVETRARVLYKAGTENVKFIYFAEFDQMWGDAAYNAPSRDQGGGLEADSTNIETKNIYVWFKIPNTSFDFKVGVQNQTDSYAGTFFGVADMAGVFTTFKFEPVSFRLAWAKFWEGGSATAIPSGSATTGISDDVDLYVAEAKFSPMPDLKLGLNFYFLNDMSGGVFPASAGSAALPFEVGTYDTLRLYMPGVDAAFKVGPVNLSAFAFYQFGTFDRPTNPAGDVDVAGFAGDIRADLNLGPGKLFIEGLYVSGDDNRTDTDFDSIITASNYNLAAAFYFRADTPILLPVGDDIRTSQALAYDVGNGGAGLILLAAGYSQKLTDRLSGKVGVGYLAAAEKRFRDGTRGGTAQGHNFASKKDMATEVNANVNYNITTGLDVGLYGAYAFLGDAYDLNAAGTAAQDPDDLYSLYARLNYAF